MKVICNGALKQNMSQIALYCIELTLDKMTENWGVKLNDVEQGWVIHRGMGTGVLERENCMLKQ